MSVYHPCRNKKHPFQNNDYPERSALFSICLILRPDTANDQQSYSPMMRTRIIRSSISFFDHSLRDLFDGFCHGAQLLNIGIDLLHCCTL